jgi:hypothetical protein
LALLTSPSGDFCLRIDRCHYEVTRFKVRVRFGHCRPSLCSDCLGGFNEFPWAAGLVCSWICQTDIEVGVHGGSTVAGLTRPGFDAVAKIGFAFQMDVFRFNEISRRLDSRQDGFLIYF